MKLYEVPAGAKIKLTEDGAGTPPASKPAKGGAIYKFFNVDGMYSYCEDENGEVVHLAAWTDVEIITDE